MLNPSERPVLWPHSPDGRNALASAVSEMTRSGNYAQNRSAFLRVWYNPLTLVNKIQGFTGKGDFLEHQEQQMKFYNGEGSEDFADKWKFCEFAGEKGYRVPRQVLLSDNSTERLTQLQIIGEQVLVKPRNGSNGIGIDILENEDARRTFVANAQGEWIAQEFVNTDLQFRWNAYKNDASAVFRAGFERKMTRVVGDGRRSVGQLLRSDKTIPLSTKILCAIYNRHNLGRRLAENEEYVLAKVGNENKGGMAGAIYTEEFSEPMRRIDMVMIKLIKDMEQSKEPPLSLSSLSFDIGVIDRTVLEREYSSDEEMLSELKANIVLFECQAGGSLGGYFRHLPRKEKKGLSKLIKKFIIANGHPSKN